ncbi:hypothetical protein [Metabacillus sp. RGM 3146]|uniref:hypothetical protein n=1 Tax=Metabacillus sp. RGM 3146 TaxID=3401092 RepID=UPI003B99A4DD
MSLFSRLFSEKCPKCSKELVTRQSNQAFSLIIKSCPEKHFEKVYHPALETYIEIDQ